jgi:hypothetical protein
MAYALEKITLEDQKKILEDAKSDTAKQQRLAYAIKHHEFTENWAVDRERNSYLLRMPSPTREESWDVPYFVFTKSDMYRINREGQAGHRMYFDEKILPAASLLTELEEEIRAAFAVHGCWGDGPLNERGIPVWAIDPQFTMKSGAYTK